MVMFRGGGGGDVMNMARRGGLSANEWVKKEKIR